MSGNVYERARALIDSGRPEQAAELLRRAVASDPHSAYLWCLLACALLDGPKTESVVEEVLAVADRAVAVDPHEEWGHRLRSIALEILRRGDEAEAAAREAVRVAPHDWQPHRHLAEVLVDRGNGGVHKAWDAARRAAELAPADEPDPQLTLGRLALKEAKWADAEAAFRRVLAIDPDHAEGLRHLALALDGRQDAAGAAATFRAAIAADPRSARTRHQLDESFAWHAFGGVGVYVLFVGAMLLVAPQRPARWHAGATLGLLALLVPLLISIVRDDSASIGGYLRTRLRRWPAIWLTIATLTASAAIVIFGSLVALAVPSNGYLRVAFVPALLSVVAVLAAACWANALADRAESVEAGWEMPGADEDTVGTRGVLWATVTGAAASHLIGLSLLGFTASYAPHALYQTGVVVVFLGTALVDVLLFSHYAALLVPYVRRYRRAPIPVTLAGLVTLTVALFGYAVALRALFGPISGRPLLATVPASATVLVVGAVITARILLTRHRTRQTQQ